MLLAFIVSARKGKRSESTMQTQHTPSRRAQGAAILTGSAPVYYSKLLPAFHCAPHRPPPHPRMARLTCALPNTMLQTSQTQGVMPPAASSCRRLSGVAVGGNFGPAPTRTDFTNALQPISSDMFFKRCKLCSLKISTAAHSAALQTQVNSELDARERVSLHVDCRVAAEAGSDSVVSVLSALPALSQAVSVIKPGA
jgi:hypothetical protein